MSAPTQAMHLTARSATTIGIALLIMGMLVIAAPVVSGLAVTLVAGVMILAAGVAQMTFSFKAERFGQGVLKFLLGGVSVLAGLMILGAPMMGLASIALILGIYFLFDGITSIIGAFAWRPFEGWGWMLFGGIASIALAYFILSDWPVSGEWAIALLVGIRLILRGWSLMMLGAVGDDVADQVEEVVG